MDSQETTPSVPRPRLCPLARVGFICSAAGLGMTILFILITWHLGPDPACYDVPLFYVPVFALLWMAPPAVLAGILCASIAVRRIRKSGGALRGAGWARGAHLLGLVWLLSILGGFAFPQTERSPFLRVFDDAHALSRPCFSYAGDHQGHFPATLDDLVPDYLPRRDYLEAVRRRVHVEYLGGRQSDGAKELLRVWSDKYPHRLIVFRVDGEMRVMKR